MNQSMNESINQSKYLYSVPHVTGRDHSQISSLKKNISCEIYAEKKVKQKLGQKVGQNT